MPAPEPAEWLGAHSVPQLFQSGCTATQIAPLVGLGERRVRQIIAEAGLRPAALPVPSAAQLDKIISTEVARHGGGYGYGMLRGALSAHYPELHLPRRRVLEALQRLFPRDAEKRSDWTAQRLERGRYRAPHTHYSWHLDYACKLQDYGIYVGAPRRLRRCAQPRRSRRLH